MLEFGASARERVVAAFVGLALCGNTKTWCDVETHQLVHHELECIRDADLAHVLSGSAVATVSARSADDGGQGRREAEEAARRAHVA